MKQRFEIYEALADSMKRYKLPLIVDGQYLIDQLKFDEEGLFGRISGCTIHMDGLDIPEWLNLEKRSVAQVTQVEPVDIPDNAWCDVCFPVQFAVDCHWCGKRMTAERMEDVRRAGWSAIKDPMGNELEFCSDEDCQDAKDQYEELFSRCK